MTLKDWDERDPDDRLGAGAGRPRVRRAVADHVTRSSSRSARRRSPSWARPAASTFRLQDRGGNGHEALLAARNQLLGMAAQSKRARRGASRRPGGRAAAAARHRPREGGRARRHVLGAINSALVDRARLGLRQRLPERRADAARGRAGRCAGPHAARGPAARSTRCNSAGRAGAAVGLRDARAWITGPMQTVRYNGYPAMRIAGASRAGRTAPATRMAEMERLAGQLPPGIRLRMDRHLARGAAAGARRRRSCSCFSLLAVFLCLAALYESWSIPLSVLLVVPLGVARRRAGDAAARLRATTSTSRSA
ncbi:MAG: efflux RND transporter permease subunit [Comamonadaceae bacterium]|nr:efflux RND transporter permease subunit [Comamonadaceae bacterium]